MDLWLSGKNRDVDPEEVAPVVNLTKEQVAWVYEDIEKKRATTRYLHERPILVDPVKL